MEALCLRLWESPLRGSILAEAPVHASLVIDTVSIDSRLTGKDL
ncbi:hypothetical protein SynMVIR181_01577 [Synechococcus sp. MVIR-18-1]|nr:hypothetical protein SynMVIR181_01577 [Synechococcus sp. MVIR-18-1]